MNLKSPPVIIILTLITLCCALVTVILWTADPLNLRAPKDEDLLTLFHDHRAEFERLRQMVTEDMQNKKASYFGDESSFYGKLDETRKQEYKYLVSRIYPGLTAAVDYDATVIFDLAGGGWFLAIGPGWMKGIEYVPGDYRRKGEIVQNLDNAKGLPSGIYLREIEPRWFIVYQHDD